MPPLEWSIIQSLLLNLVIPGFVVALGIQSVVYWGTRSEILRSVAGSLAFLISIAVVNYRNDLVPILAMKRIASSVEASSTESARPIWFPWEFETGWYSLVSVTMIAVLAETILNWRLRQGARWVPAAAILMAALVSAWMVPWDLVSARPWSAGLMMLAILFNTMNLRQAGHSKYGYAVPLTTAIIWGGSATAVAVLSHSARFADLAMMLSCSLAAVGFVNWYARQKLVTFNSGPATFIPGLMLETALNTYSEIPVACYGLVSLAPGLLAFASIPRFRSWFDARPLAMALLPMIPCVTAVGLAIRSELWK